MRMVLGAITPLVLGALLAWNAVEGGYVIREFYQGQSFFDHFDFFTGDDPTHGYVNYVDRNTAQGSPFAPPPAPSAILWPGSVSSKCSTHIFSKIKPRDS